MTDKRTRQSVIQELIASKNIVSQEQLVDELKAKAIVTTQTTLSRDINELGIWKSPHGYALPQSNPPLGATSHEDLAHVLRTYCSSIQTASNLVVIKTPPGRAQPIGYELDMTQHPLIVGNISGDDTIFIATRSDQDAIALMQHLHDLMT